MDATTTAYSASDETSGTGYTATGEILTSVTPVTSGVTALCDFDDRSWTTASFTARGALLYNDTHATNAAVCVLDFGSDKTVSTGTFTVQFPAADASNAIIRIA